MAMLKPSSPRRLTAFYLITLISITLLSVASQAIFQWVIQQQRHDALVIGVASRQMVLNQQISKDVLFLAYSSDAAARIKTQQELQTVLAVWKRMYKGLQYGDTQLGLSVKNSTVVQALYQSIQPDFMVISQATQDVLSSVASGTIKTRNSVTIQDNVQKILTHGNTFSAGMDTIIGRYRSEAETQISTMNTIELILLFITLIILAGEALFVFRPAASALQGAVNEVAALKRSITQQKQELGSEIDKILQTRGTIAAGDFQARWQITYALNNLLARFNSLLQIETNVEKFQKETKKAAVSLQVQATGFADNHEQIQKDMTRLAGVIREAKTKKHPVPILGSCTMVAVLYQELGGNYISSSPPSKKNKKEKY
jgi:uncharacterized protein YukE